jgi:hypothetical protein
MILDKPLSKLILKKLDPLTHRKWIKACNRIEKDISIEKKNNESIVSLGKILFFALLKELFPVFEVLSRRFSEEILEDIYSKGSESSDIMAKEVLDKIKNDTSCFYFPERNFELIREATLTEHEEAGSL